MSDPQSKVGEPVEEPHAGDTDVVQRANEGLADADAAGRDAVPDEGAEASADTVYAIADESSATPGEEIPWYDRPEDVPLDPEPGEAAVAQATVTEAVVEPAVLEQTYTVAEPTVGAEPVAPVDAGAGFLAAAAQPIFVQAPEPPRPRGNRGAAGAIGLVATLAFAVVFFGAILVVALVYGATDLAALPSLALRVLATWAFWIPVVVFFLAFWLLGAFINRGRWGHWVVWGLLVGVASWGGYLLGQLLQAPAWTLTARQSADLLAVQALAPLAIVAFVLGRELTIWFGAWVARRGRRVTEANAESLAEYERTLEAGPQVLRG